MEFLKLIIKPNKYVCFFCFKENTHLRNIYDDVEIEGQGFSESLNLVDMIKYLFPYFEITLQQACQECTNLILKMYINLRKNILSKKILEGIINILNTEINLNEHNDLNSYLNIDLSRILNSENETKIAESNDYTEKFEEKSLELQCPHCSKIFDNAKLFKNHLKCHERKKTRRYYNCNFCNYKSLCRTSVQGHVNKFHLKSRPYVCKICYKSFYHKKNLTDHEKTHVEKNNEICEVCGKRFLHRKNLNEHLKLHFGEKPYECEICSKKFVTSGRRLEHIKRIHQDKSECCLLCEKKFSLNKELTRHMKTVHSL